MKQKERQHLFSAHFCYQQELHVLLYKHVTFPKLVAGATTVLINENKALWIRCFFLGEKVQLETWKLIETARIECQFI